jgi:hypothetical protein
MSRTPVEAALRHLGARRYGNLVEIIEHAIRRPEGRTGTILSPLTASTSVLREWTPSECAHALWRVIEEGIVHPEVGPTAQSRRRRVLQAAFRLPDEEVGEEWGASLTERFKQLRALRLFSDATSTQPMEIAWKRGVERLSVHLAERLDELRTPEDWGRYRQVKPADARPKGPTIFRQPSEGAQKLFVDLQILTVIMRGTAEARRIAERLITSQDDSGLEYYKTWAFTSDDMLRKTIRWPTQALWGCRARQVEEDGMPVTQLWFPRPLRTGQQAHFAAEAVYDATEDNVRGWADVKIDHYGIEAGRLHDGVLPVSGLTIRIRFDRDSLPTAVWWYAEQNDLERYVEPPLDSPRRLDVVCGDVVKTFEQPCQPRESYGIAYSWLPRDGTSNIRKIRGHVERGTADLPAD